MTVGFVGAGFLGSPGNLPLLSAPLGASAIILFALPASPLAQPWSILGGNVVSAAIGVTCAKCLGDPLMAAMLAGTVSVAVMFVLRCLHPPGGALALMAVLGGPAIKAAGYGFVLWPVAPESLILLVMGVLFNNLTGRRYPHLTKPTSSNHHKTTDPAPLQRVGFRSDDLDAILRENDEVVDVSRDSLEALFRKVEVQAYHRRFGRVVCADIMSRDIVSVTAETPLRVAWGLLRQHSVKALPVVSDNHHVVGIITQADLIKHSDWDANRGLRIGIRQMARRVIRIERGQAGSVGQVMTAPVPTARQDVAVAQLVPLMADAGLEQIPIVNDDDQLVGIVAQSDLIAGLFRSQLATASGSPERGRATLSVVK
ncbi:HPP family protein [Microvirga tunisiensis]|uniref:HPP family protein n=1 Tax=Microvirga tunisiensis TaxID=2108360 RepID=A0A5N7MJF4_9HYPH|nr:HPP family protein [Microvirga tunisiensis]MPR08975.1 HPP family protein [Microvirga tunisiensis]MPR27175.1 HPP family protein [Microvirga tunisiensis]